MNHNNKILNDKLKVVLELLDESKQELKAVEKKILDQELRSVILQLIEENTEYSNQLSVFIDPIEKRKDDLKPVLSLYSLQYSEKKTSGDNLLENFSHSECTFEKAYRQVLNSWLEREGLKEMMVIQLNGIKCTFLKLKIKCLVMKKERSPYPLYKT